MSPPSTPCAGPSQHGGDASPASALSAPPTLPSSERSLVGEHTIAGFRNADITARLYRRSPADSAEAHRLCERVSRLIVELRGHGLVAKVPRARLYRVTAHGQRVMTAAVAFHDDRYPTHYLAPAA